jgi:Transposase DDE domain
MKPTQPAAQRPEWPEMLFGSKSVRGLLPLLEQLPPLSDHPNRALQTRDVFVAHLLAFFNPALRSLRTLEDFSRTRQARRYLAVERLPKSTLADFHRLVDPAVLGPIVGHLLRETARRGLKAPADLPASLRQVLAVDGTFLALAADVAWAVRHATNAGQRKASVRIDVHLDVASGLPRVVNVHGAGTSEPAAAAPAIVPGAVHVYDRGYFDFALIGRHLELSATAPAPFVMRMRQPGERSPKFERRDERPLSARDRAAGVISDHGGRLAGSAHRRAPGGRLREVVIASPEEPGGVIRLLTDLLDVPAWVIGLLYRYRWQVELFFRWLKATAHFRHLLSERREAIAFEVYVAVIGTLLLALRWEARPSRYAFALLHQVAGGGATAAEILPILAERERRCALDRESQRRRQRQKAEAKGA